MSDAGWARRLFAANCEALKVRHSITVEAVCAFLVVEEWGHTEGSEDYRSIQDLAKIARIEYATMSRLMRYLGDFERNGVTGCGLVQIIPHPDQKRKRCVQLSPLGMELAANITAAMLGRSPARFRTQAVEEPQPVS